MQQSSKLSALGVLAGVVGGLLLALIIVLVIAYTGSYNIAASEDHSPFVRWTFDTTMQNSVRTRAEGIAAPGEFDTEMVTAGAHEYDAMCRHCHGAPGARKEKWAEGMLPQPPHLPDAVSEWEPNEVFWLVKHGVKMSGMPAFGEDHDDATIWNIVAFATRLPGMTAEEYGRLTEASAHAGHAH